MMNRQMTARSRKLMKNIVKEFKSVGADKFKTYFNSRGGVPPPHEVLNTAHCNSFAPSLGRLKNVGHAAGEGRLAPICYPSQVFCSSPDASYVPESWALPPTLPFTSSSWPSFSRYNQEFLETGKLGKGGFGTVFKVKDHISFHSSFHSLTHKIRQNACWMVGSMQSRRSILKSATGPLASLRE